MKIWQLIYKGLQKKCPHCGVGNTMHSYLKQYQHCPHCHEDFTNISPDDAPAWATILIAGHIVTSVMLVVVRAEIFPFWGEIITLIAVSMVLILILLPPIKGVFINIIWYNKKPA